MMKKLLLIVIFLTFNMLKINAQVVTESEANEIAKKFMNAEETVLVKEIGNGNTVNLFIFNTENGFVIVSGDKNAEPIVAFSENDSFNPDNVPDNFKCMLEQYSDEIDYIRNGGYKADKYISNRWEMIENEQLKCNSNSKKSFLLQTTWDQGYPYNVQCPTISHGGDHGHVYTGCVITAVAQIMKYYEHPEKGVGEHSYQPESWGMGNVPTQYANFGETEYHFEIMPNSLSNNSSEDEIFYVAQLMFHLQVAFHASFDSEGTGAYGEDVPEPMTEYFSYSPDAEYVSRGGDCDGWKSRDEWENLMRNEIEESRPFYYEAYYVEQGGWGGQENWYGHAFVCDGYDEATNSFHFNWGWSGDCDCWCVSGTVGYEYYGQFYDYDKCNAIITNLHPNYDAVEENNNAKNFDTYPNPATDFLVLKNIGNYKRINIYNIVGQVVTNELEVIEGSIIDLTSLAEGVYFISAESESTNIVRKFVKK